MRSSACKVTESASDCRCWLALSRPCTVHNQGALLCDSSVGFFSDGAVRVRDCAGSSYSKGAST